MCLALRDWRTMATQRYTAKFDLFLSLNCAPRPPPLVQSNECKGSNFAIWQPWCSHDHCDISVIHSRRREEGKQLWYCQDDTNPAAESGINPEIWCRFLYLKYFYFDKTSLKLHILFFLSSHRQETRPIPRRYPSAAGSRRPTTPTPTRDARSFLNSQSQLFKDLLI